MSGLCALLRLDAALLMRRRLPRWLIDWLFANLAVMIRRRLKQQEQFPRVGLEDFPIVASRDDCLDLMALCKQPRTRPVDKPDAANPT